MLRAALRERTVPERHRVACCSVEVRAAPAHAGRRATRPKRIAPCHSARADGARATQGCLLQR
eukprot:9373571-Pyramimonas_sp.AAC.1